jgi:hypothetical protein
MYWYVNAYYPVFGGAGFKQEFIPVKISRIHPMLLLDSQRNYQKGKPLIFSAHDSSFNPKIFSCYPKKKPNRW